MENRVLGLSFAEYDAIPYLNPSTIKHGARSMLHLRAAIDRPKSFSSRADILIGQAAHAMILEVGFDAVYVVWTDGSRRTNAYKEFAADETRTILVPSEHDAAAAIRDAVLGDKHAAALLKGASREVTLIAEEHGVPCKGRVDALNGHWCISVKTTRDVRPFVFGTVFSRLQYAMADALYMRWSGCDEPYIITVEQEYPHDVLVYDTFPPGLWLTAEARALEIIERFAKCQRSGVWPGVAAEHGTELRLPAWDMPEAQLEGVLEL